MSAIEDDLTTQAATALGLSAAGVPVFPCKPDKTPLTRNGFKDASTDLDQVREWWGQYPYAVPGVPTGEASGLFALDVDRKKGKDGFATLASMGVEVPATRTHKTQSGGAHILFEMPKGVSLKNTVDELGSGLDTRADGGYIVWWPANGLPVENADAGILPMPQWLLDAVTAKPAPAPSATPSPSSAVAEGGRNDHLFRLASGLRGKGLSEAAIEAALLAENHTRCAPPLPDAEVRKIAQSTTRYPEGAAWKPADQGQPLQLVEVADVFASPPPAPDYWIEQLMPAGVVTLLGAHGGTGKSMLALIAAVCMAQGLPFMGKATKPARVAFYSGEDPAPLLRWRLANICRHLDVDPADLSGNLIVLDATEGDPALYTRDGDVTRAYTELLRLAENRAADVFIIDNASDTFDGDEIRRAEVRKFVRALARLTRPQGGGVLLLVHIDRASARGNLGNDGGYSGSTAWHNSARSRLFLVTDAQTKNLELKHEKCNVGPRAEPIRLTWGAHGVIVPAGSMPDCSGLVATAHRDSVLKLLAEFYDRGEYIPTSANAPGNAFKTLQGERSFPPRMQRAEFWRLLRDAERAGHLVRELYRTGDRKERERWSVTAAGRSAAGIAPSAPTVRQPEESAPGASGAPSAPTAQGGMGGERARTTRRTRGTRTPADTLPEGVEAGEVGAPVEADA